MTSPQQRHRVLAGLTRSRLLRVLRAAEGPLAVRDIAATVGLHPNSVREQLDQLVGAGLVERQAGPPVGRGRPSHRYTTAAATDDDPRPYRELARVLAEELARLPDPRAAATAAGDRWGRALAASGAATDEHEATRRLVALLDDAGFAPEPTGSPGEAIRLRHCPFESLARERGDVICSIHLGLMRGALRELGAPFDAVGLEPFVQPDLCIAHLSARPDG